MATWEENIACPDEQAREYESEPYGPSLLLDLEIPALGPGRQEKFMTTANPRVGPHGSVGRTQGRKAGKCLFHHLRRIVEKLAVETMMLQFACRHIILLRGRGDG